MIAYCCYNYYLFIVIIYYSIGWTLYTIKYTKFLHNNLLPSCVIRNIVDLLLLICHGLCGIHNFLEHCPLPKRQQGAMTCLARIGISLLR